MLITGAIIISVGLMLMGIVYSLQDKLIFFPEKLPRNFQFMFSAPFEEKFFKINFQAEIHALHFRAKSPKGVLLYFHGNAGSLRTWGQLAADFLHFDYDVFMVDYRGFGKSFGPRTEAALHQDAQFAYNYLTKQYPENKIIILGRSIGTGMAVPVAAQNKPKALILETPFFNFYDVAKTHYPFLPVTLLLKYTFRSDKWLPKVKCPVYIFHGTADNIVPYSSGKKLAEIADQNQTKLITISQGGHNDLGNYPQYQLTLRKILE